MSDQQATYLSFSELCLQTGVAESIVVEIIEQGIVEPVGDTPGEWLFSPAMLVLTKKAVRLHRDLDVNWAGIALAIELLNEVEQLREQNRYLQSRLSRFVDL
ncbi:chaperone modulator CbpM [Amphritea pacifica]|uniref:Chaperone modulatory protein CbpM n=1 Tax=Amphritea pacifica TaxID=2811233 RepID=A0ABS2W9E1_9GAMM|nr:chaperone modulator CbpM [Amphritea pacifica]MBN0988336.1 chaperone modulatory protein CbpM [Amphritea pacifica]MBN1005553.1 chaperone modulatory protein CbpM [Amphritea pacifica]